MWDSYDESMTLRLLDEANYDAEMESKVLPALDACMTEGWMDPATVDWNGDALPKLDEPAGCTIAVTTRPNSTCCVRTALRACSAVRSSFRTDSPNSRENTARWHGISCWPAIPYASSSIAGTVIPCMTWTIPAWCGSTIGAGMCPISQPSPTLWAANTRAASH